jgi:hypothetical protein
MWDPARAEFHIHIHSGPGWDFLVSFTVLNPHEGSSLTIVCQRNTQTGSLGR